MERTRLYNTSTGKWEYVTIRYVRMPWKGVWPGLRWVFRYARRHSALFPRIGEETVYYFDPATLDMRDPKRERRMRRRDRRDRFFAKVSNALTAMVEMQKFIG